MNTGLIKRILGGGPAGTVGRRRSWRRFNVAFGTALLLVGLNGCAGMQEGSTARTAGEVVDDSYISAAINRALLADAELSFLDINVDVNRGVVILQGNVTTAAAEQKLTALARTIRGVRMVKSRLILVPGTPNP